MKITSIQVGPIMTNCYLLCDETAGVCALIDPGDDAARVARLVEQSGCTLQYILLTHGHFDHTSAVRPLLEQYPDVPVYIHEKDAVDTERGELETPGHSEGSVCLLVEGQGVLFAGDTLFRCSCGRCDFPGGDYRKMLASLGRLAALEGNLRVLPGHDMETTLDYERRVNPYMRQGSAR